MNAIVLKEKGLLIVLSCLLYVIIVKIFYQYYVNKKGIPLSEDLIIYQGSLNYPEPGVKYYYQY